MNLEATLSKREFQVAERLALGEPQKMVADKLSISRHTVANTAKNIYKKADVHCAPELTAWYFYKKFNLKQIVLSLFFIGLVTAGEISGIDMRKTKVRTTVRVTRIKRKCK